MFQKSLDFYRVRLYVANRGLILCPFYGIIRHSLKAASFIAQIFNRIRQGQLAANAIDVVERPAVSVQQSLAASR